VVVDDGFNLTNIRGGAPVTSVLSANMTQEVSDRRAYLVSPNESLLAEIEAYRDQDFYEDLIKKLVVMTDYLPWEEYFESWRAKILVNCKMAFLSQLLIEYPAMEAQMAIEILGSNNPSVELFDRWWLAEEIECLQIPTDWKTV
jgi:hypothetical protein